jgi:hypothetical protein
LRRSELVGLDVGHVNWTTDGLTLLIERSKTDAEGQDAEIAIPRGRAPATCSVAALQDWLAAATSRRRGSPRTLSFRSC